MSEKRDSRAVRRSRLFDERLAGCWDEFKWLYCELYGQTDHLNQLMVRRTFVAWNRRMQFGDRQTARPALADRCQRFVQ